MSDFVALPLIWQIYVLLASGAILAFSVGMVLLWLGSERWISKHL